MDAKVVAYVAARLLALYLIAGNALGTAALAVMGAIDHPPDFGWVAIAAPAAATVVYLVAGAAIWMSSRWISNRVAGSLKTVELADSGPDRWKALSVALTGALSLVTALKILVNPSLWMNVVTGQIPLLPIVLQIGLFLAVGIALVAFQNTIVRAINAVVAWANAPFIGREP